MEEDQEKQPRKQKELQHFALDEADNIIDIKDVETKESGKKVEHHFFCPNCHQEMFPKQGKIRRHHFSHKAHSDCPHDGYLHALAEKLIMDWFNKQDSVYLIMNTTRVCESINTCKFSNSLCKQTGQKGFNLKEYYDSCTPERTYKGFRADLFCNRTNNSDDPIFIEIFVTHKCEEEKKNSGIRIIEIKIETEEDILSIINSNKLTEGENIKLYNFKKETSCNNIHTPISKYILFPSQKSFLDTKFSCKNYDKKRRGIFEISVNRFDNIHSGSLLLIGKCQAFIKGYLKKDCQLCFWQKTDSLSKDFCMLYKKCGNPKYCKDNNPLSCQMFKPEIPFIQMTAKLLDPNNPTTKYHFDIWEKPL